MSARGRETRVRAEQKPPITKCRSLHKSILDYCYFIIPQHLFEIVLVNDLTTQMQN